MRLRAGTTICIIFLAGALVVCTIPLLTANLANAQEQAPEQSQCDFMTGGGFIIHDGAHANFGVAGGCKHGSPTWGHLEYIDHGTGLKVHWTSITAYINDKFVTGDPNLRVICGTARTNQFGDVNFVVLAGGAGEPGVNDQFDIRLKDQSGGVVYDTATEECIPHYLGSSAPCSPGDGGGGKIQLHKPNPSFIGGGSCPAL